MFKKIQHRLLRSYLLVLASILSIFVIGVRVVFSRSLAQQTTDKLIALGQGVAASSEVEDEQLKIESELSVKELINNDRSLQWFDTQGKLISQQGKYFIDLPFSANQSVQTQSGKVRIRAVTLPIIESENGKLVGYIRVSQSLEEFDETLRKLDLGLGSGVIIALIFSSIGGVILTRQAMQPIEESFQRLKQFTADASHELRSPLMAVKSNAAVALKYSEGIRETDKEKFEAIASATKQMTRLTEDLLLLARTDKIQRQDWQLVNLTSILEDLFQLYRTQTEAKTIQFKTQLTKDLYLMGDAVQLMRLFTNLIQNAISYTPEKGTIEIIANRFGSQLIIKVKDTGIGIAPEHLQLIFERFWRADKARSYANGGSGLGLAIAQAICLQHQGEIVVTSQVGIGSCFEVRLRAVG
ncbi:two-component sensor histidine kinase [Hydrococcus rivularis NIES-593]|uniref:histidine kinase n=1 Tax=Hydrococcus rivularis NIES-593 TaxID=1921803 RepID=A0A1U7HCS6_9CYAN|nr:ATP-binding protein [Hydrococcus rivularis]OKH21345.1 two-component sensor histidine kinase [Hydrococcus rivularis NIES-593]